MPRRVFLLIAAALAMSVAFPAAAQGEKTSFELEVRVIEVERTGAPYIDGRLQPFAKDLKALPFARFTLKDHHRTALDTGEQMSFQFPDAGAPKNKKRFLVARAHGEQRGGKLRFQLTIKALDFDTLLAVKDGGTVFVGGPRTADRKKSLVFAVTARKRTARAKR